MVKGWALTEKPHICPEKAFLSAREEGNRLNLTLVLKINFSAFQAGQRVKRVKSPTWTKTRQNHKSNAEGENRDLQTKESKKEIKKIHIAKSTAHQ